MLYVITEDENSGRDFWGTVMKTFLQPTDFTMVEFDMTINSKGKKVQISGNLALDALVNKTLEKSQAGDSLFVAFDNIGMSRARTTNNGQEKYFDSGDFINRTKQKCMKTGVDFYITSYYCFEEIYLSYLELENLVRIDSKKSELASVIEYVRRNIENGTDYYKRNNVLVKKVIALRADANKNKEHFTDALLFQATRAIVNGKFTISKKASDLLKCWMMNCADLQKNGEKNHNFPSQHDCQNCKFKMREHNAAEKLLDLSKNSLINNAKVTFDDLKEQFTVKI